MSPKQSSKIHTSERTPLLRDEPQDQPNDNAADGSSSNKPTRKHSRSPRFVIMCILLATLAVGIGDQLEETPLMRIFESVYCYQYWETHDPSLLNMGRDRVGPGAVGGVDEWHCKIPDVQGRVATLAGYQTLFDGIPSLLLAIPFGIAADKIGRRPILLLSSSSFAIASLWKLFICWFWQTFDIRLVWASALHGVIGGSFPVLSAMFYVIISDVTNENGRASVFLLIGATRILTNFIAPPAAALLMNINPWIPCFAGVFFNSLLIIITIFTEETLDYQHPSLAPKATRENTSTSSNHGDDGDDGNESSTPAPVTWIKHFFASVNDTTWFMRKDWRLVACMGPFVIYMTQQAAQSVTLLYASSRYSLTFSRATLIISIGHGCLVFSLLVLIPLLSRFLTVNMGLDARRKDLYLARYAMAMQSISFSLIAFAPNTVVFVLGQIIGTVGYGGCIFTRSFMTSLTTADNVAKLFMVISVVETLSLMASGPLIAWLLETGFRIGSYAMGLPFWFLSGMYVLLFGLLAVVKIRKSDREMARS